MFDTNDVKILNRKRGVFAFPSSQPFAWPPAEGGKQRDGGRETQTPVEKILFSKIKIAQKVGMFKFTFL